MSAVTIAIVVRDAAATIERAVQSAVSQCDELLLVDDHSSDDTVERARRVAGEAVRVVRPPEHRTLGAARQFALDHTRTPALAWLDADDELLPRRVKQVIDTLDREGSDVVADGAVIHEGTTGKFVSVAPIPAFARLRPVRLFERNYLPAPGLVAMRTDTVRALGYDARLHGAEDVDIILRVLASGGRVHCLESIGCRVFAYPRSVSRDLDRQRAMYRTALDKHAYEDVRACYRAAGCPEAVAAWAIVSIALFRGDLEQATHSLDELSTMVARPLQRLEPDGPCPFTEAWRLAFHRGTVRLLAGDARGAAVLLQQAEKLQPTPEGANNLGVAFVRTGQDARAKALFEAALERFPAFMDARVNLGDPKPHRITTHPIRIEPVRLDYRAA